MQTFSAINPLLNQVGEDVMGFLNEIQLIYPQAISLGSGRPDEQYFGVADLPDLFDRYVHTIRAAGTEDRQAVMNRLGQYNRTKGIINNLVAKYLENDEGIRAAPEDILITVGTQESLVLSLITLCNREQDIIMVEDPAYVGITHLAIINGYRVQPVPVHADGISLEIMEEKIQYHAQQGKKVKLVYVTPDFQNPTGISMSLEKRYRLLEMAQQYDFLILEDNAYGDFSYGEHKPPALKALDTYKRVLYLRSFSKTLYPSLRLGALVAGQMIRDKDREVPLSDQLAKTKGYITVNTPAVNQAVLGGLLIKNNCTLKIMNEEKVAHMKRKRDRLLAALHSSLTPAVAPWAAGIQWNVPQGGFFVTVQVPFTITREDVITCAEQYGVLFTPMSFFYFDEGGHNQIRLAFSYLRDEQVSTAIERLALFLKSKVPVNNKMQYHEYRK